MRPTLLAVLVLLLVASPAQAGGKSDRLSMHRAERAVNWEVASRSFTAAVGAGPATVTYDPVTGLQQVEYAAAAADYALGPCERRSPRSVWCPWRLWVMVVETKKVVYRESGGSIVKLKLRPRRHLTVADEQPVVLRRPASDWRSG